MNVWLILFCTFFTIVLIFLGVDFYFYIVNRYCRFHIGKWDDNEKWKNAVYKIAKKWSKRTPTVKITDNSRYILLDIMNGKYRSSSIQSWQNAAIILGLFESNEVVARNALKRFIDETGNWKKNPVAVDAGMLSYAILKVTDNTDMIRPAMDYMLDLIMKNTDKNKIISYTGGTDNPERYVDTIGLVCPFLALYAQIYEDSYAGALAFQQLDFYHKYGLYEKTCLPNHAINIDTKLPLGVYGWGRGIAWYVIGLIDTYLILDNNKNKRTLEMWILEAAENYKKFQQKDGGFGSIIQRMDTYDSSATAVLAYFYLQCSIIFNNQEYFQIAKKCLKKLMSVTRFNGKIDWCQGDTKGIGIFAQTFDIMPFAQGFALRAIGLMGKGD
ncbi:MAG: glycoside hydrolase family 88 protein [Lachnospiraceae bacterium]|nr:glycoside hydrolase family 88 protein [Lachnospiraceae bacterium]